MIGNNNSLKKAALVGLGTIALEYKLGLESTNSFSLVALCDSNPNAKGKDVFPELPFYDSIKNLIDNEKLDLIIVSTPPASHFSLIEYALVHNINVLVEKPMLLDFDKIGYLYDLADQKGLTLNTSYHWQYGEEVKHLLKSNNLGGLKEIEIIVNDPYSKDGVNIDDDKIHLEGSWIDSGVNALSLIKMLLPFDSYSIDRFDIKFAKNINQPIKSDVHLIIDGIKVHILVDWTNHLNQKISRIITKDSQIDINHSEQSYTVNGSQSSCDSMIRLTRHYYNYFTKSHFASNKEETELIHRILLDVRDQYEKNPR